MLRRSDPYDPSKGTTAPELTVAPSLKTHLRTYSRRSLKRRHTSPPNVLQHVEPPLTRTGSLNVTEQNNAGLKTAERRSEAKVLSRSTSNRARQDVGSFKSAKKTPNDLTWEALASSQSALISQEDGSPDDGRPEDARVVECPTGQNRKEQQQPAFEDTLNGSNMIREGIVGRKPTSETVSSERGRLEGSDGFEDGSSEIVQDTEFDDTALPSSSEGQGITISSISSRQKPKNQGRLLVFDRSPPDGFKVLHKPRVNPDADEPGIKRKRLTDGFTANEARPISLGKRRRLQHLDINVGSLDMTQTGLASQQKPKDTSPEPKVRLRTRKAAGLRRRPQYFGTSQFEGEPQDAVEFHEVKITPTKSHQAGLDSFGPVIIPRTDSPRPKNTIKIESPSGVPDELIQDSSPSMHLLPKRSTNGDKRRTDPLALRPGLPSRPKSGFVVTDTPLLDADTGPWYGPHPRL